MKRLLFILLLIHCGRSFSQDTLLFNRSVPYLSKYDNILFILTFDNWSGLPENVSTKFFRSRGLQFLLMADNMRSHPRFGFAYGIGFSSQNVHSNATVADSSTGAVLIPLADSLNTGLNKLSLNFLDAAFELRFHTRKNEHGNRWKLSLGLKGGILLQDHIKQANRNGKFKNYNTPWLNTYQYGVMGRVGYSFIALHGYYALSPVFAKSLSGKILSYSLGIAVTL